MKKALRAIDVEEESTCRPRSSNYLQENHEVPAETFDPLSFEAPAEVDILDSEAAVDDVFLRHQQHGP